jgi:hypothetical protein
MVNHASRAVRMVIAASRKLLLPPAVGAMRRVTIPATGSSAKCAEMSGIIQIAAPTVTHGIPLPANVLRTAAIVLREPRNVTIHIDYGIRLTANAVAAIPIIKIVAFMEHGIQAHAPVDPLIHVMNAICKVKSYMMSIR